VNGTSPDIAKEPIFAPEATFHMVLVRVDHSHPYGLFEADDLVLTLSARHPVTIALEGLV
jgi:hypothetical protein